MQPAPDQQQNQRLKDKCWSCCLHFLSTLSSEELLRPVSALGQSHFPSLLVICVIDDVCDSLVSKNRLQGNNYRPSARKGTIKCSKDRPVGQGKWESVAQATGATHSKYCRCRNAPCQPFAVGAILGNCVADIAQNDSDSEWGGCLQGALRRLLYLLCPPPVAMPLVGVIHYFLQEKPKIRPSNPGQVSTSFSCMSRHVCLSVCPYKPHSHQLSRSFQRKRPSCYQQPDF